MKMPNGLMSKLASVIIPVTLATTIATTNLIFQFASAQSQQQEQDLSTLFSGEVKHRGRTYDLSIYEDRNKEMSYKIKAKDSWEIDKNLIPKILCYALSKKIIKDGLFEKEIHGFNCLQPLANDFHRCGHNRRRRA